MIILDINTFEIVCRYLNFADLRSLKNTCKKLRISLQNSNLWIHHEYTINTLTTIFDCDFLHIYENAFEANFFMKNLDDLDEFNKWFFINLIKNKKHLNFKEFYEPYIQIYDTLFTHYELVSIQNYIKKYDFTVLDKFIEILENTYFNIFQLECLEFYICNKSQKIQINIYTNFIVLDHFKFKYSEMKIYKDFLEYIASQIKVSFKVSFKDFITFLIMMYRFSLANYITSVGNEISFINLNIGYFYDLFHC
jgi:hypothetical protein